MSSELKEKEKKEDKAEPLSFKLKGGMAFQLKGGMTFEEVVSLFLSQIQVPDSHLLYVEDGYLLRTVDKEEIGALGLEPGSKREDGERVVYKSKEDSTICFFSKVEVKQEISFPTKQGASVVLTKNL